MSDSLEDGGWSFWGPFSNVSCSCGVKTRTCDNPEPRFGGADCEGEEVSEEVPCDKKCMGNKILGD